MFLERMKDNYGDVVVARICFYEIKVVVFPLFTNMCSYICLVYL